VVVIATKQGAGRSGVRMPVEARNYSLFKKSSDQLWDPPSLLFNGYLRSFPGVKRSGCEVNHSPDLILRSTMNGAMPPLPSPHNSSWRGLWRLHRNQLINVGLKSKNSS